MRFVALFFVVVPTLACSIDFDCGDGERGMCWREGLRPRGTCVDPKVRSGALNQTMVRNCVREINVYLNLFYDEACEVQEVIPTEYGVACRCRRVPVQHNTTLDTYRYGSHTIRLWRNDTAMCIYRKE
jgi:hypothetical protein